LTATLAATNVALNNVTATCTGSSSANTTPNRFVWIFWGQITYNTTTNFDTDDNCQFTVSNGCVLNIPQPQVAGQYGGMATDANGDFYTIGVGKCEIIGTLQPAGVGNVVGSDPGFTFDPQIIALYNGWALANSYSWNGGFTTNYGPQNDIPFDHLQQTTPTNDKLFAIDCPGVTVPVTTNGCTAEAVNFTNYIYLIYTGIPISDPGLWNNKSQLIVNGPPGSGYTLTGIPNTGNVTLPTNWNGF